MKTLVAYFSAQGTTANIARQLAEHLGADLYQSAGPLQQGKVRQKGCSGCREDRELCRLRRGLYRIPDLVRGGAQCREHVL